MHRMRFLGSSLAVLAILAMSCLEASAKVRENFEKVVPFEAGGSFRIENINGSITVQTWDEPSVKIEAEKVARTQDQLEGITIDIQGSGDSVAVKTRHHRKSVWGSASVSYTILLPAKAQLDVRTANGAVRIDGIHGQVTARSTNGSLKLENIRGAIDAETTNGSIRASYLEADGRHRFTTTNGSVRIYLPSDAGGELEAETVNGGIAIDFPTELTRTARRHKEGYFGESGKDDGASFEIETVNGSIKLLER